MAAILQAAARVLTSEGYDKASTNRIAQVAGVSIGTLYQYFDDKDAIYDALVEDLLQEILDAASSSLVQSASQERAAQIQHLAASVLHVVRSRPDVLPRLRSIPETAFQARLEAAKVEARRLFAAWLISQDEALVPAEADLTARLVADFGEGLLLNLSASDDIDRLAAGAAAMVHAGVTRRVGTAPAAR